MFIKRKEAPRVQITFQSKMIVKNESKKSVKVFASEKKKRCQICCKKLKVFEKNLCSCGVNVCMKHLSRSEHDCKLQKKILQLVKVVAPKISMI